MLQVKLNITNNEEGEGQAAQSLPESVLFPEWRILSNSLERSWYDIVLTCLQYSPMVVACLASWLSSTSLQHGLMSLLKEICVSTANPAILFLILKIRVSFQMPVFHFSKECLLVLCNDQWSYSCLKDTPTTTHMHTAWRAWSILHRIVLQN